jgi:hypothetical protein
MHKVKLLVTTQQLFGRNKKDVGLCNSLPWEGVGKGFIALPIPLK